MAGGKNDKVTKDNIGKLTPSFERNAVGTASINVPTAILRTHNLMVTGATNFTVYVYGAKDENSVKVSYHVQLVSPRPF